MSYQQRALKARCPCTGTPEPLDTKPGFFWDDYIGTGQLDAPDGIVAGAMQSFEWRSIFSDTVTYWFPAQQFTCRGLQ